MIQKRKNTGFVALMSAIIISAILLVLLFTLGVSSYFNRYNTLDTENKRIGLGLAEACINRALITLAQDPTYSLATGGTGTCVSVGGTCPAPVSAQTSRTCKICSVEPIGGQTIITVRSLYNQTYTNIQVTVSTGASNFIVNSWKEVSTGAAGCTVP